MGKLEIRRMSGGDFDEAVASDAHVHVEVMSIGPKRKRRGEYAHVWVRITSSDGRAIVLNLYSDTAINCVAEMESADAP